MKTYFLVASLFIGSTLKTLSQDTIKAFNQGNKLDMVFATNLFAPISASLEFNVKNKSSIYFCPRYFSWNFFGRETYISITAENRHYFTKLQSLNGWYLAPYIKYRHRENNHEQDHWFSDRLKASANFLGGGLVFGYQKVWPRGFTLNVFAGPGYLVILNSKVEIGPKDYWNYLNGIDFRLGFSLGGAFSNK
jgi:hypothetical protein